MSEYGSKWGRGLPCSPLFLLLFYFSSSFVSLTLPNSGPGLSWLCLLLPLSIPLRACMLSCFSCFRLFATLCKEFATVAYQDPLSMGFSRQEYWSGLPFPPPGDLPDPGIKPASPALAGGFFTPRATWESSAFIYLSWKLTRYLQRFFFSAVLHSIQNLSSLTGDRTPALSSGSVDS